VHVKLPQSTWDAKLGVADDIRSVEAKAADPPNAAICLNGLSFLSMLLVMTASPVQLIVVRTIFINLSSASLSKRTIKF